MNPATWHALNNSFELVLLTLSQGITLLIGLASILFIIFCLGSAACDCFAKAQPFTPHQQSAPIPPEPGEYDLLAARTES